MVDNKKSKCAPSQAIILCGGEGTRLRPYTLNTPKPMVFVCGRPFLYYILEQLSKSGINKFLLLTGYLGEKICEYFGDGSTFGWTISYSNGPTEWETSRRIWEAKDLVDPSFLLLYSDNYVQVNILKLIRSYLESDSKITLTLSAKTNGNIMLSDNLDVVEYDNSRARDGFNYVEVGYMVVTKNIAMEYCEKNRDANFSSIIRSLVYSKEINGVVVHDPYHSISDPERLQLTENYFNYKKIILIDRDGTINRRAPKGEYITSIDDFEFLDNTIETMGRLSKDGFGFIVISNQAGISRGVVEKETVNDINKYMVTKLAQRGIKILDVYISPDGWDCNSFTRKPAPGMFIKASMDYDFRLDRVVYIGDDQRDCLAALNANCGMVYLNDVNDVENLMLDFYQPFICKPKLSECYDDIIKVYKSWM